jgi:hypothetical protein
VEADLVFELDDSSADLEEGQAEGLKAHRRVAELLEPAPERVEQPIGDS